MEQENLEDISTKTEINLNSLPLICLVEIAGFIDIDKNCLKYRNISKKFNEAIQMKLFMKTKDGEPEFYKKYFLILNSKCHDYFNKNISPLLVNADTVYDFFNFKSEEIFNKLFNYSLNELKQVIISNNLKYNLNNLEKTFKKSIIRFITIIILKNFEKEEYDSLNFSNLAPYNDAKEMIILLVRLMKKVDYLDLSNMIINDDIFLGKLLDKISSKERYTLILEGIYISSDIVKKIKMITDKTWI